MDFKKICRLCLSTDKQFSDIFTNFCIKRNILYSDMINSCTKLELHQEDGLPRKVCRDCIKQLKKAYTFNQVCESSDRTLRKYLDGLKVEQDWCKDALFEVKTENDVVEENGVAKVEERIKFEEEEERENDQVANNDYWDADDNVLLGEIKIKKDIEKSNVTKTIKKRGRRKKVYPEGITPPLPDSKSPHQCDVCGKVVSTRANLKAHKLICQTDLRPWKCTECPSSFRGHSALIQHKRKHTGETPYHCEYCPKRFPRRNSLINHIRIHTGERLYNCDICCKTFVQQAQLSIHMKRHKGDKSYLCQDCGKGFPIKSDLQVHMRTHNGEKPYSCHLCTRTFATAGNMATHIRIHKKEIRYICGHCSRGFVTHSGYSTHVKRHLGQRDHRCDCGKTFYTSTALKQHKLVHTGEKNYQCKICEKKFTQSSHLNRHFKKDHAKPDMPLPSSDFYKIVLKNGKAQDKSLGLKCEDS